MGPRTSRLADERGFSLIELLIVSIVVGILAAVALPVFLRQGDKGNDASAKSNARGLATAIESCFAAENDYTECNSRAELEPMGVPLGPAPGEVELVSSSAGAYEVRALSEGGGSFAWAASSGTVVRTCSLPGEGECPASGKW